MPVAPFGFPRGWIRFIEGGCTQKVSNLFALFQLGYIGGQLDRDLQQTGCTYGSVGWGCALVRTHLAKLLTGVPVPFVITTKTMQQLVEAFDAVKARYESAPTVLLTGTLEHYRLVELLGALQVHLNTELDALPIWFVTKRRAYSIDNLINNAEEIFDSLTIPLLSARTTLDIKQAGRAIAFEVPTAAGFHAIRATESVARGYHEILIGVRPEEGTPLGPLINALRNERDRRVTAHTLDREDLLHIVIETLNRLNNVYRKPITHPDMILDLSAAMNVFDSAKCAIELMLEDANKKNTAGPIQPQFF
jgi:hypothetical protein